MAFLAAIAPILKAVGTVVSVVSSFSAARNEEAAGAANAEAYRQSAEMNARIAEANARGQEATAAQLKVRAGQERAAGQRAKIERLRQSRVIESQAVAAYGASGGGISDPTVVQNLAELQAAGGYLAELDEYHSEQQALGFEDESRMARYGASVTRYEGAAGKYQAGLQADREIRESGIRAKERRNEGIASLIGGATSLYTSLDEPGGGSFSIFGKKKAVT